MTSAGEPLASWFADEARGGQKGTLTCVWRGVARGRRRCATAATTPPLFGAVCPQRRVGAAIVMPAVNSEAMAEHLEEISTQVTPGAHAVLLLDGAGRHQPGRRLPVPGNISLLPLPAYAPELNPMENVWEFLRANFLSHRVWDTYEAILKACRDAWDKLMRMPERVAVAARLFVLGDDLRDAQMVKVPPRGPKGPPPRPAHIGFRTSNEIKRAAARAAKAEKMSLSAWIELVVVAALKAREGSR